MNGLNTKTVYHEINKELGGVYYSSSQSSELRDTQQVHRKKEKAKKSKGVSVPELSGELSTTIMLQRSDPEFIKIILCILDSCHVFSGTTIQLNDVVKMCCDFDNVLCIDTTFNLCSSWATGYNNNHLTAN